MSGQLAKFGSCAFKDCLHNTYDNPDYYFSLSPDFALDHIVNATIKNCKFHSLNHLQLFLNFHTLLIININFKNCDNDK